MVEWRPVTARRRQIASIVRVRQLVRKGGFGKPIAASSTESQPYARSIRAISSLRKPAAVAIRHDGSAVTLQLVGDELPARMGELLE